MRVLDALTSRPRATDGGDAPPPSGDGDDEAAAASLGRRLALAFAAAGAALAAVVFIALAGWVGDTFASYARELGPPAGLGVAALLVVARFCGGRLGARIGRGQGLRAWRGAVVGVGCLAIGTLAGALSGLVRSPGVFAFGVGDGLRSYVGKPFYWVMLFGAPPAALLGAGLAWTLRWRWARRLRSRARRHGGA